MNQGGGYYHFMRRSLLLLVVLFTATAALAAVRQRSVRVLPPPPVSGPTFSREIVRIFQQHCQSCHHPGDIAPFSLMTYSDAKLRAPLIKFMTQTHEMPPWKPEPGCGEFEGARVMAQSDIDLISQWVANGAPEGNPADLPAPLEFAGGWALGQPDAVLANREPYTPPVEHDMYRCFTVPANNTSDSYVSAVDVRPGDPESVHHVIAYIDTTGASQKLDDADPQPGYECFGGPGFEFGSFSLLNLGAGVTLGGWAPGSRAAFLPADVAYLLPANSRVVMQVHYHVHHGHAEPDQTQLGIYYAKKKPAKLLRVLPVINQSFTIPPGASDYPVTASFTIPFVNTHIMFVTPHMHLLGKTMKVTQQTPGAAEQCLINITDWDFNWQGSYFFKTPIAAPKNTTFSMRATYDNSSSNPRNPNNPPKAVKWGEATTDEMAIAFIGFTLDDENLNK